MGAHVIFGGIDNGADGAIVLIDATHRVIFQEIAPTINVGAKGSKKRIPNVQRMAMILRTHLQHEMFVILEKAQPYPKEGAVTSFNYGRGYGAWEMGLAALGIPYEISDPKEWQGVIIKGIEGADTKARALLKVQRMIPTLDTVLSGCRVPHLGLPDAGCMALYALQRYKMQSYRKPAPPPPRRR